MAIKAHHFQAAATILQALLERAENKVPNDPVHAAQAVDWVNFLIKAAGDDPVLVMSGARLIAGFMKNPQSAHCNRHELMHYAINGVRNLVAAFAGTGGAMIAAPAAATPAGVSNLYPTSVPQPQAAPPPPVSNVQGPPPVFMPPSPHFTPGAPGPMSPPPPMAMAEVPDQPIPDFSDLAGMR